MTVHYINPYEAGENISFDVLFLLNDNIEARLSGSSFPIGFDEQEAVDRAITAASILFPAETIDNIIIDYPNGNTPFNWIR
jgi:hypothetical protein